MEPVNGRFWRVEPTPGTAPASVVESPVLTSPTELIAKLRRLDGIVQASWDDDAGQGNVHALGIVRRVDERSATVDWRRYQLALHPSPQGSTQWRNREFFKFADAVATRYRLIDHFENAFGITNGEIPLPQRKVDRPIPDSKHSGADEQISAAARSGSSGPRCNRVAPDGRIVGTPARGLFMGNRASPPRWLICDLHFKRDLKQPRKYTKLFFLDEAVALAAGHRPCNTCRGDRYQAYMSAVKVDINVNGAAELDSLLGAQRSAPGRRSSIASLPDGAFVDLGDDNFRLKWSGALHRWTPSGYIDPVGPGDLGVTDAEVLMPRTTLAALRNGYMPIVHESAQKL